LGFPVWWLFFDEDSTKSVRHPLLGGSDVREYLCGVDTHLRDLDTGYFDVRAFTQEFVDRQCLLGPML
jgi:hypothetical protein